MSIAFEMAAWGVYPRGSVVDRTSESLAVKKDHMDPVVTRFKAEAFAHAADAPRPASAMSRRPETS